MNWFHGLAPRRRPSDGRHPTLAWVAVDLNVVTANGARGAPQGKIIFLNQIVGDLRYLTLAGTPLGGQVSYAVAAADLRRS